MNSARLTSMAITGSCLLLPMLVTACLPPVYLIDRQTVLELEASGDWQRLDDQFCQKELATGPLPLEKTQDKIENRNIFGMTHADAAKGKNK